MNHKFISTSLLLLGCTMSSSLGASSAERIHTGTHTLTVNSSSPTVITKFALQDSSKIKGIVRDSLGTPLPTVVITEKNTTNSVTSNENGEFALEASPTATLIFVKSPFAPKEVAINNQTTLQVTLTQTPEVTPEQKVATAAAKADSTAQAAQQRDSTTVAGTGGQRDSTAAGTTTNDITAIATVRPPGDSTAVSAQGNINGVITDENGPLVGATVSVKNSTEQTQTDEQGKYSINAAPSTTLVFSSVGYKSIEEVVGDRQTIDMILTNDSKTIASVDVVAVGYGTMQRATLASAVSSIGSDQIENEVLPSITQAIQGKAGGVQVSQKSGSPGGGLNIRVRGTTSINASSDPLYVVDGIPVNSTTNFTGGSNFNFGGGTQGINILASINPSDVQSVEILKDAASSSIYGARAANGVVLITTKKGQANINQFNFNMYEGFSEVPKNRYYELMNTEQYQDYMRDFYSYTEPDADGNRPIPEQILSNSNINTDWQDAIFRTAPTRSYELSASGGSEKTQYYSSVGYMKQGGVLLNSNFSRLSGRINLDHQQNEKLRFSTSVNLTRALNDRVQEENSKEGPTKFGYVNPPNIPVYNADGSYGFDAVSTTRENPVAMLELPINNAETFRVLANVSAEYSILESLKLKTAFGTDISFIDETFFMPPSGLRSFESQGGIGARRNTRDQLWINETTLAFDKVMGDHTVNALAGVSVQESRLEFVDAQRSNFPSNDIEHISAGGIISGANAFPEEWAIASGFARVNYNYLGKYIVTANLRSDGSSRFGADNRWATFPSFAAAWRVSEEPFLQGSKIFSDLKLRASWGVTGNQNIGNYASYSLYSGGNNYLGQPGFIPNVLGDRNLKWETTRQLDVGIDMGLFENRISLLADYYVKNTSDLLLGVPVLTNSGYTNRFTNSGDIENKGFEFELTTRNFIGEFKWTTSLNMTFNRNTVTALPNGVDMIRGGVGDLNIAKVGLPLGTFFGWKMIGVNPETGIIDFLGKDGQPTNPEHDRDRTFIGDPNPDFFGGITNTFQYKNIDLSIMGQFTYGNDLFNYNLSTGLGGSNMSSNAFVDLVDRWRQPGDITDVPRPTPGNLDHAAISDRFVEDGSFFRLRNITVGYTLPTSVTEKMRVQRLRWYFTVQNAFVFTNYRGYDPEVSSSHGGANTGLIYGYDYGSYPQPRIFTTGINLTF
ncbi:SusC/RagA family TonB-linked outer membrane protein [Sphingobacterium pedocola]|nr:SusC/RagA family TonB-linked outer membrane protein [Sphingobacterium pedocola]